MQDNESATMTTQDSGWCCCGGGLDKLGAAFCFLGCDCRFIASAGDVFCCHRFTAYLKSVVIKFNITVYFHHQRLITPLVTTYLKRAVIFIV